MQNFEAFTVKAFELLMIFAQKFLLAIIPQFSGDWLNEIR